MYKPCAPWLASILLAAALSWSVNTEAKGTASRADRRLAHAKELLGKHYDGSVVRSGENVKQVRHFVQTWTRKFLPKDWKKQSRKIASTILKESDRHEFDPIFLMSVIMSESSFRPTVKGPFGEIGLMQLKPATAEWIAKRSGIRWRGAKSLKDPVTNIRIGAAYFAFLREYFDSHARLYLAAYNMGQGNVKEALSKKIWPKEYPARVMQHYVDFYADLKQQTRELEIDLQKDSMKPALPIPLDEFEEEKQAVRRRPASKS